MKNLKTILYGLVVVLSVGCKSTAQKSADYNEQFRPQFHFTPEANWMNDPNGLVYHDGEYHLFYQYYPDDTVWGPMHWGHAISKDLMNWQHLPIALYPDDLGYIFSGSAVVDVDNTSGLGNKANPPMIAIFTYHDPVGEKKGAVNYQTQGIAFSLDKGRTWKKYKNNPVIANPGIRDFRDPKVMWDDKSKSWLMVLVAGDHAEFYGSKNLISWNKLSEFGKNVGAHGGVWECPDLFRLQVEGADEYKYVLLISINPGAPNGGSGTQYFVGDFDGTSFTTSQTESKWIDLGTDNYAGVTFNGLEKKRIFIGWMSNWLYATKVPTSPWRSAMTLPREITLAKEGTNFYLKNNPIADFNRHLSNENKYKHNGKTYVGDFSQTQIRFTLKEATKDVSVAFKNGEGEIVIIGINSEKKILFIDRRNSGKKDFSDEFAKEVHTYPLTSLSANADFRIILDKSSVEVFVDGGKYVMTDQLFPNKPYTIMEIDTELVNDLKIQSVKRTM